MAWRTATVRIVVLLILAISAAGCGEFLLTDLLDGESGLPLSLKPEETVVAVGAHVEFVAEGGFPPYEFAIADGDGEIDRLSGIYTAPAEDGFATVSVVDAVGTMEIAQITVTVPTTLSIDYSVDAVNWISGTTAGQAITGSFEVSNSGDDPGNHDITWQVYASLDDTVSPATDHLLDVGSIEALDPGESTGAIEFSGHWPSDSGTYYLVALISTAPDDPLTSNNRRADGGTPVTLPPALNIDYVPDIDNPVSDPVTGGEGVSESFVIRNDLTQNGTSQIFWQAYISSDTTVDSGDDLIDSGSVEPLAAGAVTSSIPIDSGRWPAVATATTFHLIVTVVASDEPGAHAGNNTNSANTTVTKPDVDYEFDFITNTSSPTNTDSIVSESLQIRNTGLDNGTETVIWEVRISPDPVFDLTDIFAASGTLDNPLAAGGSSGSISIDGTWPVSSGEYYLVASIAASDDVDLTNNFGSSGIIQVNAPAVDYTVSSVSRSFPVVPAGSSVSESFVYRNSGNTSGTNAVTYRAFVSPNPVFNDPGDPQIASVSLGAGSWLGAQSSSSPVPVDGWWPPTAGTYYLIVDVDAPDNSNQDNDHFVAGPFSVVEPPDYSVVFGSFPVAQFGGSPGEMIDDASTNHGGPGSHSITIDETNGVAGLQDITWRLFRSVNPSLDAGDPLEASGTISPLSAGAGTTIHVDFPLPPAPGTYFYITTISAGDDEDGTNNSATLGPVGVWSSGGNIEDDSPAEDDYYAIQAQDFGIILNGGDVANVTAFRDPDPFEDMFVIRTGPFTSELSIQVTWPYAGDSMDLYVFSELDPPPLGAHVALSEDVGFGEEPFGSYLNITGLDPNTVYYINTYSYTSADLDDPYNIEIIAGP